MSAKQITEDAIDYFSDFNKRSVGFYNEDCRCTWVIDLNGTKINIDSDCEQQIEPGKVMTESRNSLFVGEHHLGASIVSTGYIPQNFKITEADKCCFSCKLENCVLEVEDGRKARGLKKQCAYQNYLKVYG